MTWVRLDDGMLDNPKVAAHLGPLGIAMQVAGLLWSARNLTDGIVPSRVVNRLLDWHGIGIDDNAGANEELLQAFSVNGWYVVNTELLKAGFWHDIESASGCPSETCQDAPRPTVSDFLIHDFLVYQKSKADVLKEREAARLRMGRLRSGDVRPNFERSSHAPVPVPVPQLQVQVQEAFDQFWTVFPRKVGKRKASAAFAAACRRAPAERVMEGAKRYAADPNRTDEFTAHPTTWLNRDGWEDAPLPARDGRRPGRGANRHLAELADKLEGK